MTLLMAVLIIKDNFFVKDVIFNLANHTKTYNFQNRKNSKINYEVYPLKRQAA